jgi:hypothetical protein
MSRVCCNEIPSQHPKHLKFAITEEGQLISRWMHWLRQITLCQTQESRIPRQYGGFPFGIYPAENTYAFRLRKRVLSAISRFFGEDIFSALPHCRLAARGKGRCLGNLAAGRSCWGQICPSDWEEIEPLLIPGVRSQIALKIYSRRALHVGLQVSREVPRRNDNTTQNPRPPRLRSGLPPPIPEFTGVCTEMGRRDQVSRGKQTGFVKRLIAWGLTSFSRLRLTESSLLTQ